MLTEPPLHIVLAEATPTVGIGFAVIVTESEFLQPVAVMVSVNL